MDTPMIGEAFSPDWNEAKELGDTCLMNTDIRLEAVGYDWAVFRDDRGHAQAIAFSSHAQLENFFHNMRN